MNNLNDVPDQTKNPYLAKRIYTLRILEAEQRTDKNKNIYVCWTVEFVSPETVNSRDAKGDTITVQLVGVQFKHNVMFAYERSLPVVKNIHKAFGLTMEVDIKNPRVDYYKGIAFKALVSTETQSMLDEETKEPINDPDTGNPIQYNNYKLGQIFSKDLQYTVEAPY